MPNGKPGDHPITDIVIHKRQVFSDKVDGLIAALHALGAGSELRDKFDWFSPPSVQEMESQLRAIYLRYTTADHEKPDSQPPV